MNISYTSINIWRGGILRDAAVEFLQKNTPDILVLQEVHSSNDSTLPIQSRTMQTLPQELGYTHTTFAPTFFEIKNNARVEQGNAIFSRFPIKTTRQSFLIFRTRKICLRELMAIPSGREIWSTPPLILQARNYMSLAFKVSGAQMAETIRDVLQ